MDIRIDTPVGSVESRRCCKYLYQLHNEDCIVRLDPPESTMPWNTILSYPQVGGVAIAVSTTGNVVNTHNLYLTALHYHMLHAFKADITQCLECNIQT